MIRNHTPDLPLLSAGAHRCPSTGACLMECVSVVAGEPWSDRPSCTHPVLAAAARGANDGLPDEERQRLLALIPRLVGTAEQPRGECVDGLLVTWCLRQLPVAVDPSWRGDIADAVEVTARLLAGRDLLPSRISRARMRLDECYGRSAPGTPTWLAASAISMVLNDITDVVRRGHGMNAAAYHCAVASAQPRAFLIRLLGFYDHIAIGKPAVPLAGNWWNAITAVRRNHAHGPFDQDCHGLALVSG